MNIRLSLIIIALIFNQRIYSQSLFWEELNCGENTPLKDVHFINADTGFCCGETSILKTTDGGITWKEVYNQGVKKIYFANSLTGWALSNMAIAKTTDGGETWNAKEIKDIRSLSDMFFINAETGWLVEEQFSTNS